MNLAEERRKEIYTLKMMKSSSLDRQGWGFNTHMFSDQVQFFGETVMCKCHMNFFLKRKKKHKVR